MKKTLPSLRVEESLQNKIDLAIEKNNKNSLAKLTIQEFRRTALELLSTLILTDRKDIINQIEMQ